MSPEFLSKWDHILVDIDKTKIPVEFIKKLVVRLEGKKQQTINVEKMMKQGLEPDEIEEVLSRKLEELDPIIIGVEFILNVQSIANTVQPTTDKILHKL